MRTNLPVTQLEFPFPKGETLVSTTDLKGRILYCNPMFIAVSGYSRDELLGQPHNLIRHPDMPQDAFSDLWTAISNGRPWSGVIKNRRKDGDHYWVMAHITPLMEGRQPLGYMAVGTEATRAQIEAVEARYPQMRQTPPGHSGRFTLNEDDVRDLTLWGRARQALQLGMTARPMRPRG